MCVASVPAFRRPTLTLLALGLCEVGCMTPPARHPGNGALAPQVMQRLAQGVLEVVTPKLEDEGVRYRDPLPVDLLPFAERRSKFLSVGTAFAIGPNQFLTAAHVLPASKSLREHYYLRDGAGATFEIGRITKYSQYRDVAEFELTSPPATIVPVQLNSGARVGDAVFTVGNAHGEGVVVRSGVLTSFTPEEMDGRWRFIRFSAPASPGNSGGPLVDEEGRAIGVVLRKSETENLNYALPVQELDSVDRKQTEFWSKGVPFSADGRQMFVDWRFASPLPTQLHELRALVERSYMEFVARGLADFDAKYATDIFPGSPRLGAFLRNPFIPFGIGQFSLVAGTGWTITSTPYTERELASGQWINFWTKDHRAQFILERPRGTPLQTFFDSPKRIADTITGVLALKRPFAGKRIPIESFGVPDERERWIDPVGRPWLTFVWHVGWADESVILHCTPNPAGPACEWDIVPVNSEGVYRINFKRNAARLTIAYYGRIRDWVEFLALPDDFKPKALAGKEVSVRLDKDVALDLGGFRGNLEIPSVTEDSFLYAYGAPAAPGTLETLFYEVRLKPRSTKAYQVGLEKVFEPTSASSEKDTNLWRMLQKGESPYNGVVEFDGKDNAVRSVGKSDRDSTPAMLDIYYCRSGPEDEKAELEKTCAQLAKTLKVIDPGPR
jgi:hypothetical protein